MDVLKFATCRPELNVQTRTLPKIGFAQAIKISTEIGNHKGLFNFKIQLYLLYFAK